MSETPFEVALPGGVLKGHVGGEGPPALLLHGGAAVTDYMDGCARELDRVFRTMRYQQRGTYPSEADPPYSIETDIADAVRVLDRFAIDRAWVVGHSWGGILRCIWPSRTRSAYSASCVSHRWARSTMSSPNRTRI